MRHLTNWKVWVHGLVSAFIGGASASLIDGLSHVISSKQVNWEQMLQVALVAGTLTAVGYLKQSPLPIQAAAPEQPKDAPK